MNGTLIGIIIAIVLIFLAFKFLKSILKAVVILVIIVIAVWFFRNYVPGASGIDYPAVFRSQTGEYLQKTGEYLEETGEYLQERKEKALADIVEKLKGMDKEQIEAYLQKAKAELEKHGLTIEAVKKALAEDRSQ